MTVWVLLVKHAHLGELLLARLLAEPRREPKGNGGGGDRFLDAGEVGAMVGMSASWVEKHVDSLPKRRKIGGQARWSEQEVRAWMKHRETWE